MIIYSNLYKNTRIDIYESIVLAWYKLETSTMVCDLRMRITLLDGKLLYTSVDRAYILV